MMPIANRDIPSVVDTILERLDWHSAMSLVEALNALPIQTESVSVSFERMLEELQSRPHLAYDGHMLDIRCSDSNVVQVRVEEKRGVLYVDVDGITRLRICNAGDRVEVTEK